MKYFAPLSSYKPKHEKMKKGLDFNREQNQQYKKLLITEYRIILGLQDKIRKNAAKVYKQKIQSGNKTALTKRCNDFLLLEEKCKQYK